MDVLGLDIGGANLKVAHTQGLARTQPFALWRQPERLADELRNLLATLPPAQHLAVTMTGELCDCFASKSEGVQHILQAVATLAEDNACLAEDQSVAVWTTHGHFVSLHEAAQDWQATASANWLALATFAGRFAPPGWCLLVDIGTTTTDFILLKEGRPQPIGRTDRSRLASGALLYRGWRRTPLTTLDPNGAAEFFATMQDVCLILGLAADNPSDCDTADGRPATRPQAMRRLARMRCAEPEEAPESQWQELAEQLLLRVRNEIDSCLKRLLDAHGHSIANCIVSGSGVRLLAPGWPGVPTLRLQDVLGTDVSEAACAYAVAVLAAEAAPCKA